MPRVTISRMMLGVCYMQVCAVNEATDEEILDVCNRENPSGTSLGWTRVMREGAELKMRPVPCGMDSGRVHLIIVC